MAKNREPLGVQRRWSLLERDGFTCAYCGARPGNDRLHIDHIIPYSQQGSDHDNNLVTACDRCNFGKGARVAVPRSFCDGTQDTHGWSVWKRWGGWVLSWNPDGEPEGGYDILEAPGDVGITYEPRDYFIRLQRIHSNDWHSHLEHKPWMYDDEERAEYEAAKAKFRAQQPAAVGVDAADLPLSRTAVELVDEMIALSSHRKPPCGQRWRDFCDAIDFARTLIRPKDARP